MKQNTDQHIAETTLIASLLESLVSITFAETKEEKQMYKSSLEVKLFMLMPKSLITPKDKLLSTLIVYIAGYAEIEEIEVKAMQMFKNIGIDNFYQVDITTIPRNETTLKQLSKEVLIPAMVALGVDLELEFKELEGMRNHLGM